MWMVEDMGTDKFRELVSEYMGGATLRTGIHPKVCTASSYFLDTYVSSASSGSVMGAAWLAAWGAAMHQR